MPLCNLLCFWHLKSASINLSPLQFCFLTTSEVLPVIGETKIERAVCFLLRLTMTVSHSKSRKCPPI